MKKKGFRIVCLTGCATSVAIFLLVIFFPLSGFLSPTDKIGANILVVEGWLPPDGIKEAYDEFLKQHYKYIITTGIKADFDGGFMYSRGFLIFYPKEKLSMYTKPGTHLIEVRASSQLGGKNAACFNLYVNDSLKGNFRTSIREKSYSVNWYGTLSSIDSVSVEFTNDLVGKFGDRNLFIKDLIIDKSIIIPTLYYSEYDINDLDGKERIKNNYTSYASKARDELITQGANPGIIIPVPAEKTRINRTLASALALKQWLDTAGVKITGINIVSYGMHARRTYFIYSKVLGKNVNVGIVSLPDIIHQSFAKKTFRAVRETIKIIYYWFVFLICY